MADRTNESVAVLRLARSAYYPDRAGRRGGSLESGRDIGLRASWKAEAGSDSTMTEDISMMPIPDWVIFLVSYSCACSSGPQRSVCVDDPLGPMTRREIRGDTVGECSDVPSASARRDVVRMQPVMGKLDRVLDCPVLPCGGCVMRPLLSLRHS